MWKAKASRGWCKPGVSMQSVNITSEQSGEISSLDRQSAVIGQHIKPRNWGVCVTGGIMKLL